VLDVPPATDAQPPRLKLESLGVDIDTLTPEQQDYLSSWGPAA
jgi:adenosylhomocysteinase